jgi:hypothetical protein
MQSTAHRVRRLRQLSSTHAQGRLDYYKEWFGVAEWRLPGRHFDPLNFRLWGRAATVTLDLFLKGRFLTRTGHTCLPKAVIKINRSGRSVVALHGVVLHVARS